MLPSIVEWKAFPALTFQRKTSAVPPVFTANAKWSTLRFFRKCDVGLHSELL
jgi:hypothetical protein